jgi:hypothetical protein
MDSGGKMKFLYIVCLMFVSAISMASEGLRLPAAGKLTFTSGIHLEFKRQNEVVYAWDDKGRARLSELRRNEFICEYKGRETYLCAKFFSAESEVSPEVLALARSSFEQEEIEFSPLNGDPDLVSKGESYAEYLIPQKVRLGKVIHESYRYGILQNELHKIIFGNPAQDGLIALGAGKYQKILQIRYRVSKDVFEQYMFSGDFE